MTTHLHCQDCGTHFLNQTDLDRHCREEHGHESIRGQRGELPLDAQPAVQTRPAGRQDREFTRSHKE